jgi:hypothetical protein
VLGLAIQVGGGAHSGSGSVLAPMLFIVGGACVLGLVLLVAQAVIARVEHIHGRRRERARRMAAGTDVERRARALMSELCPHGWRARITLYESESVTEDGDPVRSPVALDWFELVPGGGQAAVMRRVWADTVSAAMEAMVADRRTDETLEQIELRAIADWPDLC